MHIRNIRIQKLYNSLDTSIEFNKSLSLIVGINGCGKTSVLNAVDWLLRPNIRMLIITAFESIKMSFQFNSEECSIEAKKDIKSLTLCVVKNQTTLPPITVNLTHKITSNRIDEFNDIYGGLSLEEEEEETWSFLQSLPKPTVISLDRTILEGRKNRTLEEILVENTNGNTKNEAPLDKVEVITSSKFAEFRAKSVRHDNQLKSKIILSALQIPSLENINEQSAVISDEQIRKIEEKTIRYLSTSVKQDSIVDDIKKFFSFYRETSRASKRSANYRLAKMQYKQILGLAAAFNEYETKNSEAYNKISRYIESINGFFADCGKRVGLDVGNGKPYFEFTNNQSSKRERRSIRDLSSGEKQIIILITYLAFVAEDNGVFIVDEPEVSLHPKWQREFMESFLKVCPKNTQILIATHSPEIVGKHKSSCKLLSGRK